MKYIVRFTKPFAIGFLAVIVLLFTQAMADLYLPNLMSDIVDVGIQQSGVEEGSPKVMSQNAYELMSIFMTEEEKAFVQSSYNLGVGSEYEEDFPLINDNEVYSIKADANTDELDRIFGVSSYSLMNSLMSSNVTSTSESSESEQPSSFDLTAIYPMLDMMQISEEDFNNYRNVALSLETDMLKQSSNIFIQGIYKELGADLTANQSNYIVSTGVLMLVITVAGGICTVLVSLISSLIGSKVSKNLRTQLFTKINSFSSAEYDKFSTASLITRTTNDINQVQMLLFMGIRIIFLSPLMLIGGLIMALEKSVSMSWTIGLSSLVLIGFILTVLAIVYPKFKIIQKLVDKMNLIAKEVLNGLMVIKAFGTTNYEKKRFDESNKKLADTNLFVNRVMSFMMPIMMFIFNCSSILIVWVGSEQIANSALQIGDMMAYIQYATQIIFSFFMMSMLFVFMPRAMVSAQRIAEVLDTELSITDPQNPKSISSDKKGVVEFKNVAFKYYGAKNNAIENISFTANPGETIGFIGATGSGKSTLVNLLPRFYDATEGEVIIGGVNVKDLEQNKLHSMIGYVPQKSILMSGTIESNIKFGNDNASEVEVKKAAEVSQSADFISQKEDTYEASIAQGGTNVSGGQRQRLSIARALATNPDVYIFDDSFSALDYKTDVTLRKALKEYTGDATVLIVAQRVGTIINADRIHFMENGKIIKSGTHKELLKSCPEYYEIASTQLTKEELENE